MIIDLKVIPPKYTRNISGLMYVSGLTNNTFLNCTNERSDILISRGCRDNVLKYYNVFSDVYVRPNLGFYRYLDSGQIKFRDTYTSILPRISGAISFAECNNNKLSDYQSGVDRICGYSVL